MNKIKALLQLCRWTNLLMVAFMMLLVYYFLLSPLSVSGIAGVMPPPSSFLLLLISLIFIVAGGYVINDYFDVEMDKVNKPERLIVSKVFSEKETMLFYKVLTFIGLAAALISSVMISGAKFYTLFAILLLLSALLYSYSLTYKKKMFVGNLIVSLSVAFAVFLPWLFELLYLSDNVLLLSSVRDILVSSSISRFVLIYTVFAFVLTLIREIVKDAEDFKGDIVTHCRTIPIVLGVKKMNIILVVLMSLLCLILLYYIKVLYVMQSYVASGIMAVIFVSLPLSLPKLIRNKNKVDYHRYSQFLKIIMLLGLISMIFI